MNRRALLIGAGSIGLAYLGMRQLTSLFRPPPQFEAITTLPGFRRIAGGDVSRGSRLLAGLGTEADVALAEAVAAVRLDICAALFATAPATPGVVRIAYFSDFNCPYCRVLSAELADRERNADGAVHIVWHELPLLGGDSVIAAQAAVAARRQGAYAAVHERLMRSSFQVTPEYLKAMSESVDIDADRLLRDMRGDDVHREILASMALGQLFGFYGTPGIVIERTSALGYVGDGLLDELIAIERGSVGPCRAKPDLQR